MTGCIVFSNGSTGIKFCVGLWQVRTLRNEWVFSGSLPQHDVVIRRMNCLYETCEKVFSSPFVSQVSIAVS